jgi:hypothetical protein
MVSGSSGGSLAFVQCLPPVPHLCRFGLMLLDADLARIKGEVMAA